MPIQIIIFFAWPPPTTVTGYFTLFENNWLLGLLSLDLLLDFVFGVNDPSSIAPILGLCVLSAFGFLLLTVFAGFARDVQRQIGSQNTFDKWVTRPTRSKGENYRVVGRLTVGVLERAYGLHRPYRPRLRRLGAVPLLQRG